MVMAVLLICLMGFGTHAVAGKKEGGKQGRCPMSEGKGCQGLKQLKGLSDKEMEQVKSEMDTFQKAVAPVKQNIFEKNMELISVLAKQDVDVDKAKKLQSEIFDLKNQLAHKKIDCLLNMKKISPKAGMFCLKKCFMKDSGMGGCKGAGSCSGKSAKSGGSCPGKKR